GLGAREHRPHHPGRGGGLPRSSHPARPRPGPEGHRPPRADLPRVRHRDRLGRSDELDAGRRAARDFYRVPVPCRGAVRSRCWTEAATQARGGAIRLARGEAPRDTSGPVGRAVTPKCDEPRALPLAARTLPQSWIWHSALAEAPTRAGGGSGRRADAEPSDEIVEVLSRDGVGPPLCLRVSGQGVDRVAHGFVTRAEQ